VPGEPRDALRLEDVGVVLPDQTQAFGLLLDVEREVELRHRQRRRQGLDLDAAQA
jgi:hypothetical protein